MSAIEEHAETLFISAINWFETAMVIEGRRGKRGEQQFYQLMASRLIHCGVMAYLLEIFNPVSLQNDGSP